MKKTWSDEAWAGLTFWMSQDRKTLNRIMAILKDIDRGGYEGIGSPEPLRGALSGYWSRRIDKKNRIVYRISGDTVEILQCGNHYGDK